MNRPTEVGEGVDMRTVPQWIRERMAKQMAEATREEERYTALIDAAVRAYEAKKEGKP